MEEKGKLKSTPDNRDQNSNVNDINVANISLEDDIGKSTLGTVPHITHGETITDRKSIFQGHVAVVSSADDVK